jgi:Flp pilus assembly protein TadD
LGRALLRAGNYETAFEELKRAMALNPSDPDAIGAYGEVLSLTGDSKSAIPFMEEAAQFRPDRQAGEYLALGIAYILSARPDDAVRILEQGQTRAPQLSWFSVLLAASYAQLGRSAEAEREAANVHRLLPNFDVTTFGSLMRRPEDREVLRAALQRAHL